MIDTKARPSRPGRRSASVGCRRAGSSTGTRRTSSGRPWPPAVVAASRGCTAFAISSSFALPHSFAIGCRSRRCADSRRHLTSTRRSLKSGSRFCPMTRSCTSDRRATSRPHEHPARSSSNSPCPFVRSEARWNTTSRNFASGAGQARSNGDEEWSETSRSSRERASDRRPWSAFWRKAGTTSASRMHTRIFSRLTSRRLVPMRVEPGSGACGSSTTTFRARSPSCCATGAATSWSRARTTSQRPRSMPTDRPPSGSRTCWARRSWLSRIVGSWCRCWPRRGWIGALRWGPARVVGQCVAYSLKEVR